MNRTEDSWLPTRKTLLSRLKNWEDQSSWREFFNLYWRLIYGVARQAGLTDAEAQEVVQETVITVAKQLPQFQYDQTRGSFKSWLRKTAQWRIQDQFRRRQRDQRFVQAAESPDSNLASPPAAVDSGSFDSIWDNEWRQNLVEVALERVKKKVEAKEFQVFDLCTQKGWPASKVARALHLFRPQVYYLNKKVTRLLEQEIATLKHEA